jgi:molybdopterin converting factor small subunit
MAKIKFYGLIRLKAGVPDLTADAATVKELIAVLGNQIDGLDISELKNAVIFVNGKNITEQKMYRTKLDENSEVMFLSPVSGG